MKNNWSMFHIKYLYKSLFKNTFTQFTEKREEERLYATSWSNIHPSRAWKIVRARNAAERRNKRICSRSKQPARETKNQDGLTERKRENNGTACLGWILERNRIAKFSIALRTNFYIPIELRPIENKNTKITYKFEFFLFESNRLFERFFKIWPENRKDPLYYFHPWSTFPPFSTVKTRYDARNF